MKPYGWRSGFRSEHEVREVPYCVRSRSGSAGIRRVHRSTRKRARQVAAEVVREEQASHEATRGLDARAYCGLTPSGYVA